MARPHTSERRMAYFCAIALVVLALVAALAPRIARADPANGLPTQLRPSFPLFGGGPLFNITDGQGHLDNQALTNASAHVAWSIAVPLLAEKIWGRKGLWIAGTAWIALSVVQESLFHAPPNPGPGYASEFRTDLATRVLPTAALLTYDAWRN